MKLSIYIYWHFWHFFDIFNRDREAALQLMQEQTEISALLDEAGMENGAFLGGFRGEK
jgi:hypothetical protein